MNEKARLQLQRQARRPAKPTAGKATDVERRGPTDAVLSMQHTAGNQAVQRELRGPGLPLSLIPTAGAVLGNHAVQRLIQTKLMVGPAGDSYEREADRVADQVMQAPAPSSASSVQREAAPGEEEVQTKPLAATISRRVQRAGGEEEELQTKVAIQRAGPEDEELQKKPIVQRAESAETEEEEVQKKPAIQRASSEEGFEAGTNLEQQLSSKKGSGNPLPDGVRSYMESRIGADFSGVKVHTGSDAVQMNREVQAQAFTLGQDIYMGEGKYNPGSSDGKRLLAHELTHVVQQTGTRSAQPKRADEADS